MKYSILDTDGHPVSWDLTKAAATKGAKQNAGYTAISDQDLAIKRLREMVKPGDTIYTVLRHVSRSGMMRHIDLYVMKTDDQGEPAKLYLSYLAAQAMDYRTTDSGALKVGGCGMDMGYHVVHSLSMTLYPEYECVGDGPGRRRCQSGDHVNGPDPAPYGKMKHRDGYALNHEWI